MKLPVIYLAIILLFLNTSNILAQENKETGSEAQLTKIIKICEKKEYKNLSPLMAIEERENNESRIKKIDENNSDDTKHVRRVCNSIYALLKVSDSYELIETQKIYEEGNQLEILVVNFTSGDQTITKNFKFIILENKALLYEID